MRPTFALSFVLVSLAPLLAQVPDGHWVVSAMRGGVWNGPGGVYAVHPRDTTACMEPIVGLPADLTGPSGNNTGARSIVIHPSGDLLVGEETPAGSQVGVHRLSLAGLTVAGASYYALGTAVPSQPSGHGRVPQMCLLDANTLLVACTWLTGTWGSANATQIVILDLNTGTVTPIWNQTGIGLINALTVDPTSGSIVCGTYMSLVNGGWGSRIYELTPGPLPYTWLSPVLRASANSGPVTLPGTGAVFGLAAAPDGGYWAVFDGYAASDPNLLRLSPTSPNWTIAAPALSGWDLLTAVAVEPSTSNLALAGAQNQGNTLLPHGVHLYETAGNALTWLTACVTGATRGGIHGVACAPAPLRYGAPSGAGAIAWSARPHQDGLSVAGRPFSAAASWNGSAVVWSGAAVSFGAALTPLPQFGITALVDLAQLLPATVPMALDAVHLESRFTLNLPGNLRGAPFFFQSLHVTVGGQLAASDGLHVTIL